MKVRLAGLLVALLAGMFVVAFLSRAQTTNTLTITNFTATANAWTLGWRHSATGTAYTVQFQETLRDVIWRVPAAGELLPTTAKQWWEPSSTNATRLYRVLGVPAATRGKVLSTTLAQTVSTAELAALFADWGIAVTPQYSVRLYRVTYETVNPLGACTRASGALILPQGTGTLMPLFSYQHGTCLLTNDVPSTMDPESEIIVGLVFASTGYAVAEPDYLGLSDSPGFHPYHHARSEATACVDMLRAVKSLCATNGFPLTNRLFLAGYSQGGHVTMALLRELEYWHTNEFTVTACAPMAGAYDLGGVTRADFLAGHSQPNPYYFLYLLAAYQDVYRLGNSLADLLRSPYDTTLPPLLHGNTGEDVVNAAMPSDPVQVLKPEYLEAFRTGPRHPLTLALQDNDLYRWKPRASLRLYHCSGDLDVIPANSQVAWATFQSLGATQVQLIDPLTGADHEGCLLPSLMLAKSWFDSLR